MAERRRPPRRLPADESAEPPNKTARLLQGATILPPLLDPAERSEMGLVADSSGRIPVIVELNLRHEEGLPGAERVFQRLYQEVASGAPPSEPVANTYRRCLLTMEEIRDLIGRDARAESRRRAIYRVWPDFPVHPLIDRSVITVKGDAAQRAFAATGDSITWAVIDSGIDASHPHFRTYDTLGGDVAQLHKDFSRPGDPGPASALVDGFGHGTHVAGIIAGGLPAGHAVSVTQHVSDEFGNERLEERAGVNPVRLSGVAPRCKLVSLKVLDDAGQGASSSVMKALEYVRQDVNGNGKRLRIHGVNLSVGYEFDAKWFACGQSPLCVEVNRLVRSGVVVVVAAGNTGYGVLSALQRQTRTGLSLTINDPGNAALAVTVGATHRDQPHTFGVSYFSSKGPTGDGRAKPDLVAPGERITSCAAGRALARLRRPKTRGKGQPLAAYVDDSGTSMAAPHVSGAMAAFLSIRREFVGRPEEVKRVFLETATSLGRESYFQGRGLVDLMRAIQAV